MSRPLLGDLNPTDDSRRGPPRRAHSWGRHTAKVHGLDVATEAAGLHAALAHGAGTPKKFTVATSRLRYERASPSTCRSALVSSRDMADDRAQRAPGVLLLDVFETLVPAGNCGLREAPART